MNLSMDQQFSKLSYNCQHLDAAVMTNEVCLFTRDYFELAYGAEGAPFCEPGINTDLVKFVFAWEMPKSITIIVVF